MTTKFVVLLLCVLGAANGASLDVTAAETGSDKATTYACPNDKSRTIPINKFCDGVKDCSDGSDEFCHEECGVAEIKPDLANINNHKIVNGEVVTPHSWPWQVAMLYSSNLLCGGSLIADQWVMTAAHCCEPVINSLSSLQVLVGAHNHERPESSATKIKVKKMYSHPRYGFDGSQFNNDFCLLHLSSPVKRSKEISPICLPTGPAQKDETTCFVTGWGTLNQGVAGGATYLRQTGIEIFNHSKCNAISGYRNKITDVMFCGYRAGTDTCQGDSGGPFSCYATGNKTRFDLYGVTSWGDGCAKPGVPGVYALTPTSYNWIAQTLYDAKYQGWNSAATLNSRIWFLISSVIFAMYKFF